MSEITTPHADLSADQCVEMMWHICQQHEDSDGVKLSVWHDQWWGVLAECKHNPVRAKGSSRSLFDLTDAFRWCLYTFEKNHPRRDNGA